MDTQVFTQNDDGSSTITWQFDITGTTLLPGDMNNNTTYNLLPQYDASSPPNLIPWTLDSAIAATSTQAATDKANWIAALEAAGL